MPRPIDPARSIDPNRPMPRPPEMAAPMPMPQAVPVAQMRKAEAAHGRSVFIPATVFFLAWFIWAAFQAVQLHEENKSLMTLGAGQEQQLQQAQRVRQTLDALASETQKLADSGNANAKVVIEELRKRGVTVNRPNADAAKK
jgi:hypothetical protein